MPFSSRAHPTSAWAEVGTATTAASILPASSSGDAKTGHAYSVAAAAARSALLSTTPASWAFGDLLRILKWWRPKEPAPITATRGLVKTYVSIFGRECTRMHANKKFAFIRVHSRLNHIRLWRRHTHSPGRA